MRKLLCFIFALQVTATPLTAGSDGQSQLVLSLSNQVRALGIDPAPLAHMSTSQLAQVKGALDFDRRGAGKQRTRVLWEIEKAQGGRAILLDVFGASNR